MQDIFAALMNILKKSGLSLNNLRGHEYDGVSTMSGEKSGVQRLIMDVQPKAFFTHCAGHSLNLVITKLCGIPAIRNCISLIKHITSWIKYSPWKEGFLAAICEKDLQVSRCLTLLVCMTRWVDTIDGWE